MAVSAETKILGINDLKISEITVDNSTTLTYDTPVDIPGITSLQVSPNFVEKELRGDETVLDKYSKLDSINWSIANVIMSLDALAIMIGGAVTTSGVTPAEKKIYSLLSTDLPKYFKMEGQSVYSDAGDVHVTLYKCKASSVQYELRGEEYATVSASGTAIGTIKDKKIKEIVINETAVPISGA
jgi:hypothetical protein